MPVLQANAPFTCDILTVETENKTGVSPGLSCAIKNKQKPNRKNLRVVAE